MPVFQHAIRHGGVHEFLESSTAMRASDNKISIKFVSSLGDGIPHAGGVFHQVTFSMGNAVFLNLRR